MSDFVGHNDNGRTTPTHWLPPNNHAMTTAVDCLCIGTGRFLRAVLVPALNEAGLHPILIQPRGRSFVEYMDELQQGNSYPVDTVLPSGEIETDDIPCYGAFSWGQSSDKSAFYEWLREQDLSQLRVIGVGVTEAGLASADTEIMKNLHEFFKALSEIIHEDSKDTICVVNTDNVPNNGDILEKHMRTLTQQSTDPEAQKVLEFLNRRIAFLNSMVDRITSQRDGSNGMIPRAEPLPAKALVLADLHQNLPPRLASAKGVVIRSRREELESDIVLKLRIANGTHTAVAHALALQGVTMTDALSGSDRKAHIMMQYLDSLVEHQILVAVEDGIREEAVAVWKDWRQRLAHPKFGLSTFFITQNGPAKGGIRLGPTVRDLFAKQQPASVAMAFCFAVLLRWLTPAKVTTNATAIYRGWLQGKSRDNAMHAQGDSRTDNIEYADKLNYNLEEGWYDFRCVCQVECDGQGRNLSDWLSALLQPQEYPAAVRGYLVAEQGGNLLQNETTSFLLENLVLGVSILYDKMLAGVDIFDLLEELSNKDWLKADCKFLKELTTDITKS